MRRDSVVRFIEVDGWWVPVEQPAAAPKYDVYAVMGAAVAGFFTGLVTLAVLAQ